MTTDPSPERLSDQAGRPAGVKRKSNSSIVDARSRRSNHQITHDGEITHGPWVRVLRFYQGMQMIVSFLS